MLPMVSALAVLASGALVGQLDLVPSPQQVTSRDGEHAVPSPTIIALGNPVSEAQQLPAGQLQADLAAMGVEASVRGAEGGPTTRGILLALDSDPGVSALLQRLQLSLPPEAADEGYLLDATPERVLVVAPSDAGLYYGVQTLRQLLRSREGRAVIPAVHIVDWPAMALRGIHSCLSDPADIARFAHLKMNLVVWEVNDLPAYTKHPELGGTMPLERIRQIADEAARHHVKLVLQTQSFGHAHWALRSHPELRATPDSTHNFRPLHEPTYEFLDDIYSELCPLYPAPYFFPGCDEPWGIEDWATEQGLDPAEVVGKHIARLAKLAQKHGKRQIMVWGDYLLKFPDALAYLSPQDVIIGDWHYEPSVAYLSVAQFVRRGFTTLVCPSVMPARPVFMDYDRQLVNIRNFCLSGYEAGAQGLLNTNWPVDPIPTEAYWYGWATGAQFSWAPQKLTQEQFDDAFWPRFYGCRPSEARSMLRSLARLADLKGIADEGSGPIAEVITRLGPRVAPVQEGKARTALHEELARTSRACLDQTQGQGRERLEQIVAYGREVTYRAGRRGFVLDLLTVLAAADRVQQADPARARELLAQAAGVLDALAAEAAAADDTPTVEFCSAAKAKASLPLRPADVLGVDVALTLADPAVLGPGRCFEVTGELASDVPSPHARPDGSLVFPRAGTSATVRLRVLSAGKYRVFALLRHSCGAWDGAKFLHGTRNAAYEGKYEMSLDDGPPLQETWLGDELNPDADEAMQWASLGEWDLAEGDHELLIRPTGPNWAVVVALVFTQDASYEPTTQAESLNKLFRK